MSSHFLLPESDQSRTRKTCPLELYFWPNDLERTTIITDTNLPKYQVFTAEGQLFKSRHSISSYGGIAV
jgi:hypothetical protein